MVSALRKVRRRPSEVGGTHCNQWMISGLKYWGICVNSFSQISSAGICELRIIPSGDHDYDIVLQQFSYLDAYSVIVQIWILRICNTSTIPGRSNDTMFLALLGHDVLQNEIENVRRLVERHVSHLDNDQSCLLGSTVLLACSF